MLSPNLESIAESNHALLEKLDFNPETDDPFELDTPDTVRASGLFPEHAIGEMFGDQTESDNNPPASATIEVPPSVAMLLVRPDMLHIAPRIERFIRDHYDLLNVTDVTVTPEQYWEMYKHVITSKERVYSRLTRAAVYMSQPARLMVFQRPETEIDGIPATVDLFRHKGKQGVEAPGTLRGDVIYNEAIRLGMHTLKDPQIAHISDPFGAYRKMMREKTDGPHLGLTHPLLFYTAVGVHTPDADEIDRDLALFDPEAKTYSQE